MYNSQKHLRVVQVISDSQIVLNAGQNEGIELNEEFIIYGLGTKDIYDPETGDNLGKLEIYRGTGKVIYVQNTMCMLQALSSTTFGRVQNSLGMFSDAKFNNVQVKDYAKPNATLLPSKPQN